ncbi:hypothetical protein [Streptosporangium sp. NPDC051022]|uniref:hypothetical protein n=1 Tax=Streptosporangium sp. NPDC051022 TaxID=3155752 RepID=UPI0034163CE9
MDPMQLAVTTLVIVVFVVYRQMVTRRTDRRGLLVLGLVMIAGGLAGGGVVDTGRPLLSAVMLAVELAFAVAFGAVRASTVRVWRDEAGVTWSKGTRWTMLAWLLSFTGRAALFAVGTALGLTAPPTAALVFAGLTISVQSLLVARRGRALTGTAVREREVSPIAS